MTLTCIICSRQDKQPYSLKLLTAYLRDNNIDYFVAYDHPDPFSAYNAGVNALGLRDDTDQIILCHDDVEILSDGETLKFWVDKYLSMANTGYVGVAGTTYFDCGHWWEISKRNRGLHRGFCFQGRTQLEMTPNFFGRFGDRCCVMDGCFLATTLKTLKQYGLKKPKYLTGFDYYDVYMTSKAYMDGKDNYVAPILIKHESPGVMRPSFYISRDNFLKENRQNIPLKCK